LCPLSLNRLSDCCSLGKFLRWTKNDPTQQAKEREISTHTRREKALHTKRKIILSLRGCLERKYKKGSFPALVIRPAANQCEKKGDLIKIFHTRER
jgi:hypothetical protein